MDSRIMAGQEWVIVTLRELGKGKESQIWSFEWENPASHDTEDISKRAIGLTIRVKEERRVVHFLESELEEVADNAELQARVMERLKKALQ